MPKFAFLVNNDGYRKYTYMAAKEAGASVPRIKKGLLEKLFRIHNAEPLNRYFELPFKRIWFQKVVDESSFGKEDEILFILYESFHMSYSRSLINHYKKKYNNSKFVYIFTNPVGEYNLGRLDRIRDLLDAVFSFCEEDAIHYGFLFLKADLFLLPPQDNYNIKTDIFFIGADKGRLPILIDIVERFRKEEIVCDFWVTNVPKEKQKHSEIIHYNQRLTYEEVLRHVANTKCVLEILQDDKSYSSIRTMEAIQYHKKLLTMSETVKEQWFYSPDIIQVFHCADEISTEFIRSKAIEEVYKGIDIGSYKTFEEFIVSSLKESVTINKKNLSELYRGGVLDIIRSDLERICNPTLSNAVKIYLVPRGTVFRFDVWFRILQWSRTRAIRKLIIGPVAYLIQRHYEYKYGIHVNPNIYIGRGLHIMHGDGVHLNCEYIGDNFTVYQGTTLGAKHGKKPTVLNNVTVYTNSVVCGGITLHDGCSVGAQSYLDKDVEQGVFVAGIPAKELHSKKEQ